MAHVQLLVVEPDVRFDADAAGAEGGVERDEAPVVVVAVAGDGLDVAGEVCGPVGEAGSGFADLAPGGNDLVEDGGEEGGGDAGNDGDELDDAAIEIRSASAVVGG